MQLESDSTQPYEELQFIKGIHHAFRSQLKNKNSNENFEIKMKSFKSIGHRDHIRNVFMSHS